MINLRTKIHDHFQIENKFEYNFSNDSKKTDYSVDFFLFIPNSLDINPSTYSRERFFKDIQNYTRLKTPEYTTENLLSKTRSPFLKLENLLLDDSFIRSDGFNKSFEYHIKMICIILHSHFKNNLLFIKENKKSDKPLSNNCFLKDNILLIERFRKLKQDFVEKEIDAKATTIINCADEFLSMQLELFLLESAVFLKKLSHVSNKPLIDKLIKTAETERLYRKNSGYTLVDKKNNENFIHKLSIYKKFISSGLFLKTKKENEGKVLEQVLFSFAAGLSMVFATVVAFYFQNRFGNFTMPFFVALVISYIFKDRIKDLTKSYLLNKIAAHIFDHKTKIYSSDNHKLGVSKETMCFIKEKELPEKISNIRKKDHITDIANFWREEKILKYTKKTTLLTQKILNVNKEYPVNSIHDIIRINVSEYIHKMDNPLKHILSVENNEILTISSKRIYKLNLIIKLNEKNRIRYSRYRIILNRDGLKKIEEIHI